MDRIQILYKKWIEEESIAHIKGWDFSHIDGRCIEETDFPWDYKEEITARLSPEKKLLDIDTGGGEFLLSLRHDHGNTAATEGYAPNAELCRKTLLPLGIDFREAADVRALPFAPESFDIVINRHGDFDAREINRVLKPGGVFITEQVGAENDREFVDLLTPDAPEPFPEQKLSAAKDKFMKNGFTVISSGECRKKMSFLDVGALVWFAHIIEWEFPGFCVDKCFDRLLKAQHIIDTEGEIAGFTRRFFLCAQKN